MSGVQQVTLPVRPRPLPAHGQVELWLTELSRLPLARAGDDAAVGNRMRALKLQQRFVLRLLLGSYLGRPGKDVRLLQGDNGKPELAPERGDSPLRFNLSHSGDWLAVAVTRDQEIGVDIERARVLTRSCALSNRFLSAAEAGFVAQFEEPERSMRFLALWSRREALVKAMGTTLARSLQHIRLDPVSGQPVAVPDRWPPAPRWLIVAPEVPDGLTGAVAAACSDLMVQTFLLDAAAG